MVCLCFPERASVAPSITKAAMAGHRTGRPGAPRCGSEGSTTPDARQRCAPVGAQHARPRPAGAATTCPLDCTRYKPSRPRQPGAPEGQSPRAGGQRVIPSLLPPGPPLAWHVGRDQTNNKRSGLRPRKALCILHTSYCPGSCCPLSGRPPGDGRSQGWPPHI